MTTPRSFAPLGAPADAERNPAPPVFPMLPFAFMAYAEHCTREYASHADRLAHADEPWGAEDALGLQMLSEMNQAFFQLVWAPFGQALQPPRD